MKHLKEIITIVFDKLIELVTIVLKASKVNLLKVKIILATLVFSLFTWNYLLNVKVVAGKIEEFSLVAPPNNVPIGVFTMLIVLCIYLVHVDVMQIKRKQNIIKEISFRNDISETLKNKILDEIQKG